MYLDRSVVGNELVLHGLIPEAQFSQVLHQVMVDHLEFSREHTARVDVASVGLNGFVVTEDLCRGGCGHWCQQEAVTDTVSSQGEGGRADGGTKVFV